MKTAIFVHKVTKTGITPVAQTLLGVYIHAASNFLRQFCRIVFSHALQHALHQNAAGVVADVFSGGNHPDTILFQLGLVDGAIVAIPGKAVKLVNENRFKNVFVAVRNHTLELRTAVGGAALCPVDVLSNYNMTVVFGVLIAGLKLAFNRLLRLAVAGIAGINYSIHRNTYLLEQTVF